MIISVTKNIHKNSIPIHDEKLSKLRLDRSFLNLKKKIHEKSKNCILAVFLHLRDRPHCTEEGAECLTGRQVGRGRFGRGR